MIQIIKYFAGSCMATVIDISIVWILHIFLGVGVVLSNTIAVVAGFLVDYMFSAHFVFKKAEGIRGLAIYLLTFLLGLILADTLIYLGDTYFFSQYGRTLRFLLSKGISIIIPFFILYLLRKRFYE